MSYKRGMKNLKSLKVAIAVALAVAVLVTPATAAPRKKKVRPVELTYQTPAPAAIVNLGAAGRNRGGVLVCNHGGALGSSRGCMEFMPASGELWMSLEIADASGLPIPAYIGHEGDSMDDWVPFCGSADALPVLGGGSIWVHVLANPTNDHGPTCIGAATTGTVTVTFSNLR